jgi:RNA polymerase sigma-70 factor, ECF subfamily
MTDFLHETAPPPETPDDIWQVIARCLQADQSAYSEIYHRYAGGAYRLCYSLLLNKQDAEDVLQDTFVYAFKNLHRFDPHKASFKTWLYTIAVSRCRNVYRRKVWFSLDFTQLLKITAPHSETPEASLARQNANSTIYQALSELSPRLREALVLRYGHGLTYREIAEIMNCPAKTAESRVRLAHEQLRASLAPEGRSLLEELLQMS